MERLEAHAMLVQQWALDRRELAAWLPEDVEARPSHGIDPLPAMLLAAASLSGQLDDAETLEDLRDACEHFASLWAAGIIDQEQWNNETWEVIRGVVLWGDAATGVWN
jgi:hypothetical protein